MSVWSNTISSSLPLSGSEGPLVSVSVVVDPPRLEALLDTLANLDFPINPQIYHDHGLDTVVQFPAYESRLPQVRRALESRGFAPGSVEATAMLEAIRAAHA